MWPTLPGQRQGPELRVGGAERPDGPHRNILCRFCGRNQGVGGVAPSCLYQLLVAPRSPGLWPAPSSLSSALMQLLSHLRPPTGSVGVNEGSALGWPGSPAWGPGRLVWGPTDVLRGLALLLPCWVTRSHVTSQSLGGPVLGVVFCEDKLSSGASVSRGPASFHPSSFAPFPAAAAPACWEPQSLHCPCSGSRDGVVAAHSHVSGL